MISFVPNANFTFDVSNRMEIKNGRWNDTKMYSWIQPRMTHTIFNLVFFTHLNKNKIISSQFAQFHYHSESLHMRMNAFI